MLTPDHILHQLTAEAARDKDPHKTRTITLGSGASTAIAPWLQSEHPGQIDLVIGDAHTWAAAGEVVYNALTQGGRAPRRLILEPAAGDDHLVCEDGAIQALQTFLETSERLNPIAVGAGSVNDIVKSASFAVKRGYQVVPTAASMNGYTSSISAVLSNGVKRTLPTHQPEAVFADVEVVRAAPPVMNQAGFGDLLSKPFSQADWYLSHVIRGVDYSDDAATLLDGPWHRMVDQAAGIGAGEADAITVLLETLLISGFSMAIAGTSAPASGAEHLISHYWDMEQHCQGLGVRALHGTQVGIGTLVSAFTLDRLMTLEADDIRARGATTRPDEGWIATIGADHPALTAPVVSEIQAQLMRKQRHGDAQRAELAHVAERWDALRDRLGSILLSPEKMKSALAAAGCPRRASDLGVGRDEFVRTIRVCRHIRARYTNFDLVDDLGALDDWAQQAADWIEGDGAPGDREITG